MNWERMVITLGFILSGLLWLDLNTRYGNRFGDIEKNVVRVEEKLNQINQIPK